MKDNYNRVYFIFQQNKIGKELDMPGPYDPPVCCPKCGSCQITTSRKNFDLGCGLIGLVIFGWIGALLGLINAGEIELVCKNCGAHWPAGKPEQARNSGYGCCGILLLILIVIVIYNLLH